MVGDDEEVLPDVDSSHIQMSPVSSQILDIASRQSTDDGIIEKIILKNFMCHSHFEVELDPNINFIIGQNGSGKSAILTAIIVGLGGKASATQRASAITNLIMTGANEAEITIVLRNSGLESYKHDDYGDCIKVVRLIKRQGGGSYKLKNSSGRIVSNLKEDLIKILDHFNIQVDNPVTMLSQDTSRNFLHSSNATAKYKLFMKGTHLDQIANDYAKAEESQKFFKEEIDRKSGMLDDMVRKAKLLEEEVQELDCLDDMEKKQGDLSLELSWAIVKNTERRAEKAANEVKSDERKLKKLDEKLERVKADQQKWKENRKKVEDELHALKEEASLVEQEKDELTCKKRDIQRLLIEIKNKGNAITREIDKIKAEKKAFEDKLEECRKQSSKDFTDERNMLLEQESDLKRQLEGKKTNLTKARSDKSKKDDLIREKDADTKQSSYELQQIRSQISDCEDTLRRLQSAEQNSLRKFGDWMIDVVRAIDRNMSRFKKPPKGPVGSYIKVRDQNWCFASEIAIGYFNLIGFVVDNQNDGDILRDVIRRVMNNHPRKPHPPVITCRFDGQVYDISKNMPQCCYPTLMSMIEVNDPDVMNMLIDMCGVESTILIKDKSEARNVMGNRPPVNVWNAYTIEGDQAQPNHRYYSNRKTRPMGILQVSVLDGIRQQREYLDGLKTTLRNAVSTNDQLESSLSLLKKDRANINIYINNTVSDIRKMENNKEMVKSRLEEIRLNDNTEDVATWEGIVVELEEKLVEHRQMFESVRSDMSANLDKLKAEDQSLSELDVKVNEVSGRLINAKNRFKSVVDELEKINRGRHSYEEKINLTKDELKIKERDANELAEKAHQRASETANLGDRIDTDRSPNSIQTEITKIENVLNKEAAKRANRDEIKGKYLEAVKMMRETEKNVVEFGSTFMKLQDGLQMRIQGFQNIRMRMANRARMYFTNNVSKRGYQGTLKFDVKENKLDIIVKVDKNQATKNVLSLSGGERSFSTVSFVMALWEAIESPFRCLDEFDVFMDLINRKISMKLMLNEAKVHRNRQFIFFTPQDMSALGISMTGYKILQLQPPDRSQQTI